jgi:hypothetical protein
MRGVFNILSLFSRFMVHGSWEAGLAIFSEERRINVYRTDRI